MKKTLYFLSLLWLVACGGQQEEQKTTTSKPSVSQSIPLAIGTYTRKEGHVDGKAKGIYIYNFNPNTGELKYQSTTEGIINPSYLNVHPNGQYIYAVSEVADSTSTILSVSGSSRMQLRGHSRNWQR